MEQWGNYISGGIGLIGVLAGIFVGRWQVTYQARVEHWQWLREQRQEAHLALLSAWDTCMEELQEVISPDQVEVARHLAAESTSSDGWAANDDRVWSETETITGPVRKALDRVEILGPEVVNAACGTLTAALDRLVTAIRLRADTERWPNREQCETAQECTAAARKSFLTACGRATQTAPAPRLRG